MTKPKPLHSPSSTLSMTEVISPYTPKSALSFASSNSTGRFFTYTLVQLVAPARSARLTNDPTKTSLSAIIMPLIFSMASFADSVVS